MLLNQVVNTKKGLLSKLVSPLQRFIGHKSRLKAQLVRPLVQLKSQLGSSLAQLKARASNKGSRGFHKRLLVLSQL